MMAARHGRSAEGTSPKSYRVSGDVSLTYDAAGHAILCYIAFDKLGTTNYWAQGATRNGIFIRRSLDGGHTWEQDAHAVISHESTPGIPFEDKPWVVADTSGAHAGNLYIGWTQFTLAASDLMFSRSTDGGITWSSPIKLSTVPGLPRDDNGALEGFHGVVGPDGALYTIWDARDGIMMAMSHDGGASFQQRSAHHSRRSWLLRHHRRLALQWLSPDWHGYARWQARRQSLRRLERLQQWRCGCFHFVVARLRQNLERACARQHRSYPQWQRPVFPMDGC